MLLNEVFNDVTFVTLKTHSEYDLESRLNPGQDAKVRVDAPPTSLVHGRAQVSRTPTFRNRDYDLFERRGVGFPQGSVEPVSSTGEVYTVDLEFEFLE